MDGRDLPSCVTSVPMGALIELQPSDKNLSDVPAALGRDFPDVREIGREDWSTRQTMIVSNIGRNLEHDDNGRRSAASTSRLSARSKAGQRRKG